MHYEITKIRVQILDAPAGGFSAFHGKIALIVLKDEAYLYLHPYVQHLESRKLMFLRGRDTLSPESILFSREPCSSIGCLR